MRDPVHGDLFLFGLYTGMRKGEVEALRWDRVDLEAGLFRVDETKTGTPLELPVTRQIGEILARRRAGGEALPAELRAWVFPSPSSATGHVVSLGYYYGRITKAGGVKFWFHGLRNAFAIDWSSPAVLGILRRLYVVFYIYMGFVSIGTSASVCLIGALRLRKHFATGFAHYPGLPWRRMPILRKTRSIACNRSFRPWTDDVERLTLSIKAQFSGVGK